MSGADPEHIAPPPRRDVVEAECYTPALLRDFLVDLETTTHSRQVWSLLVGLGQALNLPCIDFICASSWDHFRKTIFVRTSYDASFLNGWNEDPEIAKWSYFRSHAMHHLTPIMVGLEFIDEYIHLPARRVEVLREAAARGIRAGFSIPLRLHAPPQAALITFAGDHSRREMKEIVRAHGWTLSLAAMHGHQRYMTHFHAEFPERNKISAKQLELLGKIGLGLQDKQIAQEIGISVSAVRQRMHSLMEKTGLNNRAELAALAMSMGVLPDPVHGPGHKEAEILFEMDGKGTIRRPAHNGDISAPNPKARRR
ncbi:helix-turn-helix transcriptional regulator [Rhodalgimonas zhirmunskyi]|uniref:Autoinducer binding domain-containing protein n=1 Tax=Rhodalgimonas zhirmunskyi TaxID=2964767 RepID=A0AAJ1UBU3_9RHOB|nr:LuxR C-terminal-related transcriptional regulator [Rhodoalgimonas zhirmunskyi]MDQ2093701.1 autoinducer binding domain-containing protein [Rhodoalgimonas zhirmunskyi]